VAITTVDGLVAAQKDPISLTKTQVATTVAAQWHTLLDRAGDPGAGSLTIGNTTTGVVPTDATAGFPAIRDFVASGKGVLHSIGFGSSVACRFRLYDRLWHAGSFGLATAGTTAITPTAATGRMPDGVGHGTEIWLEINTVIAASAVTVQIGYTNSDGVATRLTVASAALTSFATGRLVQLQLQAGDRGVRQIDSIIVGGTVAATGTVNVILARPLYSNMRVGVVNGGDVHGFDKTGLVEVYQTTALWPIVAADSTSSGVPDMLIVVSSG
jgi:hypothetical protein